MISGVRLGSARTKLSRTLKKSKGLRSNAVKIHGKRTLVTPWLLSADGLTIFDAAAQETIKMSFRFEIK